MKKILVTGSSGFLGSRLAHYLKGKYALLLPPHAELSVVREEVVMDYMQKNLPDVVIHCAALSNTRYCEQHPQDSHKVNVQGTVKLAKACKQTGAKYIFMSSDQVYNGTPRIGPHCEWDVMQPVSIYGRHKLEAEQRALRNNPDSVGLRLTWMYDLPTSPMKLNSNILVNLQKASDEGTSINAPIHEFRGVTNVWEVVINLEKAVCLPGGIYNFGSTGLLNSYELHQKAATLMGLKEHDTWIIPDEERFCEQPRNLTMNCSLIEGLGIRFNESVEGIYRSLNNPVIRIQSGSSSDSIKKPIPSV